MMASNGDFPEDQPQAEVSWCARDLHAWRPEWTVERRQKWLDDHSDALEIAMIDAGRSLICRLLGRHNEEE
jgi:hypothetical protein